MEECFLLLAAGSVIRLTVPLESRLARLIFFFYAENRLKLKHISEKNAWLFMFSSTEFYDNFKRIIDEKRYVPFRRLRSIDKGRKHKH